ncbi:MAG: ABC transporter ATP-binding protein [Pseudomonadota bacterium]
MSFDLYQGETLGIIGRNGAGKTSVLKLLAGIVAPDRGEVINNGYRAALLSLQLGFAPNLTGKENVYLSGLMMGLRRQEIDQRFDHISEFAELGEFMDQPLRTYSTGMRARLGFSVALAANPDVLLIDEVLGVGDGEFRIKSSAAMRDLIQSNKTIVLVSHQLNVIRKFCDRVVWIENHTVRAEGEGKKIINVYQEHFSKSQKI